MSRLRVLRRWIQDHSWRVSALLLLVVWGAIFFAVLTGQASLLRPSSPRLQGIQYATNDTVATTSEPVLLTKHFPRLILAHRALARGGLYQIDPLTGTGFPLLADLEYRPFSPFTLAALIHPSPWTLSLTRPLCVLLGLLGCLLLLRSLGSSAPLAVAFSLYWVAASYSIVRLNYGQALYPWLILASLRRLRRGSRSFPWDLMVMIGIVNVSHPIDAIYAGLLWMLVLLGLRSEIAFVTRVKMLASDSLILVLFAAPIALPYLFNQPYLVPYKNLITLSTRWSLGAFFSQGIASYLSPVLLLLLAQVSTVDRQARRWMLLAAIWIAGFALLSYAPPFFFNRLFNPYYAFCVIPLLVMLAIASSRATKSTLSFARRSAPGVALAALALSLALLVPKPQRAPFNLSWLLMTLLIGAWLLVSLAHFFWARWGRVFGNGHKVQSTLFAATLAGLAVGSVAEIDSMLELTPPAQLADTPPLKKYGVDPGTRHRIAIVGGPAWEHPLPPTLPGLWGYMDVSLATVLLPVRYVIDHVRIFGKPVFPTFFIPAHAPRQDPAELGVGRVILFTKEHNKRPQIIETGGYVAGWSEDGLTTETPLAGFEPSFDGTWQLFRWKLPPAAQTGDGVLQIKLDPFPGYRYLDENRTYHAISMAPGQRWIRIPTRRGQTHAVLAYREDGFWLGLIAALAGLVVLLARLRHRACRRGGQQARPQDRSGAQGH